MTTAVRSQVSAYAEDVLSGRIPAGRWVRLACERHMADLRDPRLRWDEDEADRAIRFIGNLTLFEAQKRFRLEPWQAFIVGSLFGWFMADSGVRRFTQSYVEVARGNGKSPLAAAIGLYMLVGLKVHGGQIFSAATTRDQARIVYRDAQNMVTADETLRGAVDSGVTRLLFERMGSVFRPLSAEASKMDGLRVLGAMVDELHEHPSDQVVTKLRTGMGKYAGVSSLLFMITTAGYDRNSVCWEQHDYSCKLLEGLADDVRYFGYVATIDTAPYIERIQQLPALQRLDKLCTCKPAPHTQTAKLFAEAYATHATCIGTGQITHTAAYNTLTGQSALKECAEHATSAAASNKTQRSASGDQYTSPNGQLKTQSVSAKQTSGGSSRTVTRYSQQSDSATTESRPASLTRYSPPMTGDVEFAGQTAEMCYAWITNTALGVSEESYAGGAIAPLVFSETLRKAYKEHSPTCNIRSLCRVEDDALLVDNPGDDWTDEAVWYKANPNLGISISLDTLRTECEQAKAMPAQQNAFKRLRLNVWTEQATRWLDMAVWDAQPARSPVAALEGKRAYCGIDLSSTTDITAVVFVFPDGEGGYDVFPFFFVPEENADKRASRDRVPYPLWIQQGYIDATEGNVVDYAYVRRLVNEAQERLGVRFDLHETAIDRWNSTQLQTELMADGFTVVPFGQGFASMTAPTKEVERLLLDGKLRHGGNPVLRWMASNVAVRMDPAGNLKPDKEKSTERIDGIVAMVMAVGRAMVNDDGQSVYETQPIRVL